MSVLWLACSTEAAAFDNRTKPKLPTIELNLDVLDKFRQPAPSTAPAQPDGQKLIWQEGPKGQIIESKEPAKKPAAKK